MSKASVVIMKISAKPKGLTNSMLSLVGETANPVMDGLINVKLIIRIAETMFSMNNDVFICLHN